MYTKPGDNSREFFFFKSRVPRYTSNLCCFINMVLIFLFKGTEPIHCYCVKKAITCSLVSSRVFSFPARRASDCNKAPSTGVTFFAWLLLVHLFHTLLIRLSAWSIARTYTRAYNAFRRNYVLTTLGG